MSPVGILCTQRALGNLPKSPDPPIIDRVSGNPQGEYQGKIEVVPEGSADCKGVLLVNKCMV